jgi:metal-dependent amidase/aminoacylase/carboxypeptidase family protein
VIEDPNFALIKPDFAFALHNIPGQACHKILCKVGSFSCAVKSMIIKLTGKTAHASKPETGINPALAIADIIYAAKEINKQMPEGTFATLVHSIIGEKAYGISAGYGEVHFTLRGRSNTDMTHLWGILTARISEIAKQHQLNMTSNSTEEFMANTNDMHAVDHVKQATIENNFHYEDMTNPNPWGEDFGWITSNERGAMFGLGNGMGPDLHNPDYDFSDELIPTGVAMFHTLIRQILTA